MIQEMGYFFTFSECPLPWDESKVGTVNCTTTTCMKFDGWASDGKRIMMRDCGFFTADECRDEETINGVETKGNLCHCTGAHCNTAAKPKSGAILALVLLVAAAFVSA